MNNKCMGGIIVNERLDSGPFVTMMAKDEQLYASL